MGDVRCMTSIVSQLGITYANAFGLQMSSGSGLVLLASEPSFIPQAVGVPALMTKNALIDFPIAITNNSMSRKSFRLGMRN